MNNIKNVPEIRFKGCYDKDGNWMAFTHPWEQRKVLDLLELLTDYDANGSFADMAKNINTTDGDGYAWYVRITDLENPKPLSELKYVDESSYEFLKKTELHGGELLMAKRGNIGKVYIFEPRTKYATVAPNMYLLKLNNKVIPHFLYDYFVSEEGNKKLTRLNASSTMGALYKDDVKNIDVIMPSIEEQAMIGNFFQSIDHIITLHQRKVDAYERFKEGMVQKLFSQEVRFKADDGSEFPEWEEKKLGEVFKISTETNGDRYSKQEVLSVSDEYGVVNQIELQGRSFAGNDISKYKVVKTGQLIYTRSPLATKPFGIIKRVGEKIGIVSPLYIVNDVKENNCSMFWYYNFDTPERTNNYLKPLVRMGAKHTMNISNEEWLSGKVLSPCLAEQQKIAKCLSSLDNVIDSEKAKVAVLKKLKKFMLQKMFV